MLYRDDTKVNVDKLKPFTLYQFKVRAIRHDINQTSLYSESIECYTNEDGKKIEEIYYTHIRVRSSYHFTIGIFQFPAKSRVWSGSWETIPRYESRGKSRVT